MAGAPRPPRRGERLLHPHERRRAQALRPGVPAGDSRQRSRRHLPGRLRGAVLRRLRGVQDGGRARRREVPRARARARVDRGAELVLPALGLPGAAARALRRAPRLRAACVSGERGEGVHRRGPTGLLDQPGRAAVGDPDPVGAGPGRVRLGGRARQLPERAHVRAPGGGSRAEVLAGRPPPAREGHPPLPLRLLAGDAARRGIRRPAPAVRARVPPAERSEDLEVPRQRRRSSRPDRHVRGRRGAVLVRAVGVVRPGRHGVDRRPSRAVRARAGERPRKSPLTGHSDDRPLPRRLARGRVVLGLRGGRVPRAARGRRRRTARRLRSDGGARADLGGRPGSQPARRGDGAVATRQGRRARGGARPRALRPRRRAASRRSGARGLSPWDVLADPGSSRTARRARLGRRRVRPDGRGGRHRPRAAALPARRRADARRGRAAASRPGEGGRPTRRGVRGCRRVRRPAT